jgi:hypothetical protein
MVARKRVCKKRTTIVALPLAAVARCHYLFASSLRPTPVG